MEVPSFSGLNVAGAIIIGGASGIIAYEWRRRRERSTELAKRREEWYSKTVELLSEADHISERYTARMDLELVAINEQMNEVSSQMTAHANSAPNCVSESDAQILKQIGGYCRKISIMAEVFQETSGVSVIGEFMDVFEEAFEDHEEVNVEELMDVVEGIAGTEAPEPESIKKSDLEVNEEIVEEFQEKAPVGKSAEEMSLGEVYNLPWDLIEDVFEDDGVFDEPMKMFLRYQVNSVTSGMLDTVISHYHTRQQET